LALASGAFGDRLGQRRRDITDGAALHRCWDICGALPEQFQAFRARRPNAILSWLGATAPPENLFVFCGWFGLNTHLEICRAEKTSGSGETLTGFDHSVYLAFGQCLSEILGMARGIGPDFDTVALRIAGVEPASLQRSFLRHYLANIMQDYFDAAEIRKRRPRLPPSTESDLRAVDATRASEAIFATLPAGPGAIPWTSLHEALKAFFGAIFLAERDQYDNP
jgi:hypothetical protein